jgi:hypothetical protein
MLLGWGRASPLPPDRRARTPASLKAAGSFVPKIAAKVYERFGFHSAEILTQWPRVVGDEIAAMTSPARIKWPRSDGEPSQNGARPNAGAVLVLSVPPSRALDVEYRIGEIRDRINRYFGYAAVSSIKVWQSPDWQAQRAAAPLDQPQARITGVPQPVAATDPVASALHALGAEITLKSKKPGGETTR